MWKIKVYFVRLLSFVFVFIHCFSILSFAGFYDVYHYQTAISFKYKISGSSDYFYGYYSIVGGDYNGSDGDGAFASYLIPVDDADVRKYCLYIVSDRPFRFGYYTTSSDKKYTEEDVQGLFSSRAGSTSWNFRVGTPGATGYYVESVAIAHGTKSIEDFSVISQFSEMPFFILNQVGVKPWLEDGFVLGKDPSGGGDITSSNVYDASIPAPENLTFTEKRGSGLDGLLWKDVQHILHWTNAFPSEPPMVRISILYDRFDAVDPDKLVDYTYPLVSFSDGVSAAKKTYSYDFANWRDKVIDPTLFDKINEYRVQFFVNQDGTYRVGPVSTIHVNRNALGKYTGSTVTVEYPSDPDNLGDGGDNLYDSSWSTDADNVKDYDTDGNLVGTGSGDKNTIQNLIDGLLNIPTVISQFFSSLSSMMSGIGGLPAILTQLFSFLPVEVVSIIALGFIIIVVLRIFGR